MFEESTGISDQPHKFVWSTPCNTYTLAAVCEYCGIVAYSSNFDILENERRQKLAAEPCKLNPNRPSFRND